MSILAHNIYRLFALELGRYPSLSDQRVYEKFLANSGSVKVEGDAVTVALKKKRELPLLLEAMSSHKGAKYSWLEGLSVNFIGAETT